MTSALTAAPAVVVVVELVRPGTVPKSLLATRGGGVPVSLVTFLTDVLSRTVSVLASIVSFKRVSIVSFRSVSVLLFVRPLSDSAGDATDVSIQVEVVEAECTVLPAEDGGSAGFGSFVKKPKKSMGVGSVGRYHSTHALQRGANTTPLFQREPD